MVTTTIITELEIGSITPTEDGVVVSVTHKDFGGELFLKAGNARLMNTLLNSLDLRNRPPTDPVGILMNRVSELAEKAHELKEALKD